MQRVYGLAYYAVIRQFPDLMVADFDDSGAVRCAAGLRLAGDGFFSECYVDAPIEAVLSRLAGKRIGRERVIEVNNLASRGARSSAHLIETVIAFARQIRTDWAIFTITPDLKRLLCRMKLPVVVLGAAERSRVANAVDWGRYYDTRPVLAAMQDPGPETLVLSRCPNLSAPAPAERFTRLVPAHE